jgi:hypothetical protein
MAFSSLDRMAAEANVDVPSSGQGNEGPERYLMRDYPRYRDNRP